MYSRHLYIFTIIIGFLTISCQKLVNDPGSESVTVEEENGIIYWGGAYDDFGHAVVQTSDGGYAVVGSQFSTETQQDLMIVKFNSSMVYDSANSVTNFGGDNSTFNNFASDFQQTADGGYVLVGSTYNGTDYDVWVVKYNSVLELTWQDTVKGTYDDFGNSIYQTQDGNFIVCGNKYDGDDSDIVLWKFTYDGTQTEENLKSTYKVIWSEDSLGTPDNGTNDYGHYAHQTDDGGYIIAGSSYSSSNAYDIRLIKLDALGDTLATNGGFYKTFNNASGYYDDEGIFVQQTSDNGYVVVGNYGTGGWGQNNAFVLKTDYQGNQIYLNTYGGAYPDAAKSVRQTMEGGFIIVGNKYSQQSTMDDVWVIKLTFDGSKEWEKTFGGENKDIGTSVSQTSDGGYIITGSTNSYGNQSEIILLKITSDGVIQDFSETSSSN